MLLVVQSSDLGSLSDLAGARCELPTDADRRTETAHFHHIYLSSSSLIRKNCQKLSPVAKKAVYRGYPVRSGLIAGVQMFLVVLVVDFVP